MSDTVSLNKLRETAPFYFVLSQKLRIPFMMATVLCGASVLALLEFVRWNVGSDFNSEAHFSLILCLLMAMVGLGLLNQAYTRFSATVFDVQDLLEKQEEIDRMARDLTDIFNGIGNYIFSLLVAVSFLGVLLWLGVGYNGIYEYLVYLFGAIGFYVAGTGLYIAFHSLLFLHRHFGRNDLKLYVLPNRTYALVKISRLYASLSLSFSLEIVIFVVAFYTTRWTNSFAEEVSAFAFVVPFVLFTVFYIFYPQYTIHNVVRGRKEILLKSIEKNIARDECFLDGDVPNLQKINELIDVHEKITNSSDNMLSFGVIGKFVAAVLLPIAAYLFEEKPAFLVNATQFLFGG